MCSGWGPWQSEEGGVPRRWTTHIHWSVLISIFAGHLYSLTCEDNQMLEMVECFINVFSYSWWQETLFRSFWANKYMCYVPNGKKKLLGPKAVFTASAKFRILCFQSLLWQFLTSLIMLWFESGTVEVSVQGRIICLHFKHSCIECAV